MMKRHEDYLALRQKFFRTLLVDAGRRCPLVCAHCSVDARPERREGLNPDNLAAFLEPIGRPNHLDLIIVSGGEPFLYKPLMRMLSEYCVDRGTELFAVTSGAWAKTPEAAARVLDCYPGLKALEISVDKYHQPFIDVPTQLNAMKAGIAKGVSVILNFVDEKERSPYILEWEARLADEGLFEIDTVFCFTQPVGRAKTLDHLAPRPTSLELPKGGCTFLGSPVIRYDGKIFACCQQDEINSIRDSELILGDITTHSFAEIREHVRNDLMFKMLRLFGPEGLASAAAEASLDWSPRPYIIGRICDLCHDFTCNKSLAQGTRAALAPRAVELAMLDQAFYPDK